MSQWIRLFPTTPEEARTRTLPSGMRVLALWPRTTPLPLEDKLMQKMSEFGTPWKLDSSILAEQHVGVDLTADVALLTLENELSMTAMAAPMLVHVPDSSALDTVIIAEQNWDELKGAADDVVGAIGGAVNTAATVAKWAVWAPLVIGGALVVAGLVYLGWKASKERKS